MKYIVHRIDVKSENMQEKLEAFINKLEGQIISIIPNVEPIFRPYGATSRVNYLLIVEQKE
jgi:hypothetical protein